MTLGEAKRKIELLIKEHGEDVELFTSLDVSTSEEDYDHRLFGNNIVFVDHGDFGIGILSELSEDNYKWVNTKRVCLRK